MFDVASSQCHSSRMKFLTFFSEETFLQRIAFNVLCEKSSKIGYTYEQWNQSVAVVRNSFSI